MRVLVIGASGLVGGNCLNYLQQKDSYEVKGTHFSFATENTIYFDSLDINNIQNQKVIDFSPQVIIHCGALTFVDYCEQNPEESYLKTVNSTKNIIALAEKSSAKLIYISTDYVFDGLNGPYGEDAEVNPISVYGKHKLEAEELVKDSGLDFLILRITNVYGDELRGKNFVSRIISQIKNNDQINLTLPFDQYATPINALDIAKAISLLLSKNKKGIYHLGSTDYMNRCQLALRLCKRYNYTKVKITPIKTLELNQPAKRPLLGGLLSSKFLSEFPEFYFSNLDDYLSR